MLLLSGACSRSRQAPVEEHAMYYWRTTLTLSDAEKDFIRRNDVSALYLHLFDVTAGGDSIPRPSNTLFFKDTIPEELEIIPTVFIAEGVLRSRRVDHRELARNIITRIDRMMTLNGYPLPQEIQIDYDWARSDRKAYFALMEALKDSLHADGRRLSSTVRLHQLAQPAPPADNGVLMVYNTGNFADPTEKNSILSMENVEPYLRYLDGYSLPLSTALPAYDWNLLFHRGKFRMIVRGLQPATDKNFEQIDSSHYRALRYSAVPSATGLQAEGRIYPGDIIRRETSNPATGARVARAIARRQPSALRRLVIYHLDDACLPAADSLFRIIPTR